MNIKTILIILPAIFVVFSISLASQQMKINKQKERISELKLAYAEQEKSLIYQNLQIANLRINSEGAAKRYELDLNQINSKYEEALQQSTRVLVKDNSCESQLKLIYESQRRFCYE